MSKANGDGLDLSGTGAAYIRVSTDQQDCERQYAAVASFEKQHSVTIAKQNLFVDEDWKRSEAAKRPAFQRLVKLAQSGRIQWIVVERFDRFACKDEYELMHYCFLLREGRCKLYDVTGREYTTGGLSKSIMTVVEGEKASDEPRKISNRVLGGKAARARAGEWQGGPVRLGLEVACYDRKTETELWRVINDGRHKRLKVFPDGRAERFDGKGNFPPWQKKGTPPPEFLRLVPSNDKSKIAAAVSVFKRYASESISFTALAHYLNQMGIPHGYGGPFVGHHVAYMLEDPIYLGYYAWNKTHSGKYHRWANDGTVEELNLDERWSKNNPADWIQSRRIFKPLVDQKTWDAVQRKLAKREKRTNAPRSAAHYLSGILLCGNCSARMVAGPVQRGLHYFCGTYHKAARTKGAKVPFKCKCLRNAVRQEVLDKFISRYLEDIGHRLNLVAEGLHADPRTDRLEKLEAEHWGEFRDGIRRLTAYLAEHHPAEYAEIVEKANDPFAGGSDEFVAACVNCYQAHFDPSRLTEEINRLEGEHSTMMEHWADLPTPLAKEKAKGRFVELESRIAALRRQQQDVAELVKQHYDEMLALQTAIASAKIAMRSEASERALRHRAEAVRAVIQRIECSFTATGRRGSGPGNANSALATVTIYPIVGDPVVFERDAGNVLSGTSEHSLW